MASLDRPTTSDQEQDPGALVDLLDSPELGPVEEAESVEKHDQVRRAVEALPEATRQVVILVYFQGLKYREAAEVLSIPMGTVMSRLHTARKSLRDIIVRAEGLHPDQPPTRRGDS